MFSWQGTVEPQLCGAEEGPRGTYLAAENGWRWGHGLGTSAPQAGGTMPDSLKGGLAKHWQGREEAGTSTQIKT